MTEAGIISPSVGLSYERKKCSYFAGDAEGTVLCM